MQRLPDWVELSQAEQQETLGQLDNLRIEVSSDIVGLGQLLKRDYAISTQVAELKQRVEELADERRRARLQEEREVQVREGLEKLQRTVRVPARLATADQLEALIQSLQVLRRELSVYSEIEITFEFEE